MTGQVVRGLLFPERRMTDKVKSLLIAQGAQGIVTYSFISGRAADQLGLAPDDPRRQAVTLLNPLGEEYSTMRTQLLSSMLTVLSTNLNRKIPAARFFEASKLFLPRSLPLTELPDEVPALSLGLYGEKEDFFTLKGLVETLAEGFGVKVDYTRSAEPYLHPGRQARAAVGEETLAVFGELHPDTAARYGLEDRIYVGEVRLAPLFAARKAAVIYKPLPRYPAVERDLALVRETGCRYHGCHVSTKESVALIRKAKAEGLPVSCETGPHYLILCDEDLMDDGRFKMNPPIRSAADRDALIEGLLDGTIDCIATDHAPHSAEEKSRGLRSLNGIVGLECAFPVLYTELVEPGGCSACPAERSRRERSRI